LYFEVNVCKTHNRNYFCERINGRLFRGNMVLVVLFLQLQNNTNSTTFNLELFILREVFYLQIKNICTVKFSTSITHRSKDAQDMGRQLLIHNRRMYPTEMLASKYYFFSSF
jgi:hypothetical protein